MCLFSVIQGFWELYKSIFSYELEKKPEDVENHSSSTQSWIFGTFVSSQTDKT